MKKIKTLLLGVLCCMMMFGLVTGTSARASKKYSEAKMVTLGYVYLEYCASAYFDGSRYNGISAIERISGQGTYSKTGEVDRTTSVVVNGYASGPSVYNVGISATVYYNGRTTKPS